MCLNGRPQNPRIFDNRLLATVQACPSASMLSPYKTRFQ